MGLRYRSSSHGSASSGTSVTAIIPASVQPNDFIYCTVASLAGELLTPTAPSIPGGMNSQKVQVSQSQQWTALSRGTATASPMTLTYPATISAGDQLLMWIPWHSSVGDIALNTPAGWTPLQNDSAIVSGVERVGSTLFSRTAGGTEGGTTISVSWTNTHAYAISGDAIIVIPNVAGVESSAATTAPVGTFLTGPSPTPTANDVVVQVGVSVPSSTFTQPLAEGTVLASDFFSNAAGQLSWTCKQVEGAAIPAMTSNDGGVLQVVALGAPTGPVNDVILEDFWWQATGAEAGDTLTSLRTGMPSGPAVMAIGVYSGVDFASGPFDFGGHSGFPDDQAEFDPSAPASVLDNANETSTTTLDLVVESFANAGASANVPVPAAGTVRESVSATDSGVTVNLVLVDRTSTSGAFDHVATQGGAFDHWALFAEWLLASPVTTSGIYIGALILS